MLTFGPAFESVLQQSPQSLFEHCGKIAEADIPAFRAELVRTGAQIPSDDLILVNKKFVEKHWLPFDNDYVDDDDVYLYLFSVFNRAYRMAATDLDYNQTQMARIFLFESVIRAKLQQLLPGNFTVEIFPIDNKPHCDSYEANRYRVTRISVTETPQPMAELKIIEIEQ